MKILVTGAAGFIGRNLVEALKSVRDGKDRSRGSLAVSQVMEADIDTPADELEGYCEQADFVFHLAGINRPKDDAEFMQGNCDAACQVLDLLKRHSNTCPVMMSSSIHATLAGSGNAYADSKAAGERVLLEYGASSDARVLVYRFPNVFGKWCRPNYNSAVATFCHNIAHGLPVRVDDPAKELQLLYIDDLVDEMLLALQGGEHRCRWNGADMTPCEDGDYCYVPVTHRVTLGRIVELLESFADQPGTLLMPSIPAGSFDKKLYSAFLSYLPAEKIAYPLVSHADQRGSFSEILKTADCGQFSVNVTKPGFVKGQHWHNTKWELFVTVAGEGLIRMRRIGSDEVLEFPVSGAELTAVHMLPGYTHSIANVSETDDLVTLMWANELFDPQRPDTYFEEV